MIFTNKQQQSVKAVKVAGLLLGGLLLAGISLVQAQQMPTPGKPVMAKLQATPAGTVFHVTPGQMFSIILSVYGGTGYSYSSPTVQPSDLVTLVSAKRLAVPVPHSNGRPLMGAPQFTEYLFKVDPVSTVIPAAGVITFTLTGPSSKPESVQFPVIVGETAPVAE